jgi:hypothetical protein
MMRDICVAKAYAIVRAIEPVTSNGGGDDVEDEERSSRNKAEE